MLCSLLGVAIRAVAQAMARSDVDLKVQLHKFSCKSFHNGANSPVCRSKLLATGDNHWTMRCFEIVGSIAFVCFANGKLSVHNVATQELVRPSFAAHSAEIKHIARGPGNTLITSCLDNQVSSLQASMLTAPSMRFRA